MDVTPEAIQDYVDFSRKHNVPVCMGESGENTDEWVASFRTLLEQHGIGWCFWPYKKLDATSSVVSADLPPGWDAIVEFAERPRVSFQEVRDTRPAKDTIARALEGYLRNVEFRNCRVNVGYLKALGLR
jgi:hypothetical protein